MNDQEEYEQAAAEWDEEQVEARAIGKFTVVVVVIALLLLARLLTACAMNPSPCWHPQVEFDCSVV